MDFHSLWINDLKAIYFTEKIGDLGRQSQEFLGRRIVHGNY